MHPTINQKIRCALADALGLNELFPTEVVAAITLACHPWPDFDISHDDINCIAAELRPTLNINHHCILEVAADRLLRFIDALQSSGSSRLSLTYGAAAEVIDSYNRDNRGDRRAKRRNKEDFPLIASPISERTSSSRFVRISETDSLQNCEVDWHSTIISLLGAAILRGSLDTGIALGSEETGVTVNRLAEKLGVETPQKELDEYLDRLDDRTLDILASRTFNFILPDTLVDIAARWKITRERVRQIETKASERLHLRFAASFARLGKQSLSLLVCHVFRVDVLYEIASRIAKRSRHPEILSGFLANIFGPWQKSGRWIYRVSLHDRIEQLRNSLAAESDTHSLIATESIEIGCEGLFLTEADRDLFLKEEFGFGKYFGAWASKNTLRCQVVAALRKIGRPATKEELAELLEHPAQSIGSILGTIEGVVRADRFRWGFDEWIDDAYDGIYGEIQRKINEYSGSVPVQVLLNEIPSQFDVAETSVKAYLASSAFIVENGLVRMANKDDYVPRSVSQCADAVQIGDRWGYRSLISDRHFNGYSLGINFDVAFANGLRPGDDLEVPVNGTGEKVRLIWRLQNLSRLVDVGRVSNYLLASGHKAGETLILIPSREAIEIVPEQDLQSRYPELKIQSQFDNEGQRRQSNEENDDEIVDALLDMLGGDQ